MNNEPNIREALMKYIILHSSSYSKARLKSFTILELIVLKTELELQEMKSKAN